MAKLSFALLLPVMVATGLADWIPVGPDGGNVQALGIDYQQPANMYAVPYEYPDNPRVFKSTNAGASWDAVGRVPDPSVTSVCVDRHQPGVLYALGRGTEVLRSTDGGAAWSSVVLPGVGMQVCPDPLVSGRVFAVGYVSTSYTQPAVFISTDFGRSWSQTILEDDTNYVYSCDWDPVNADVAYVGCYLGRVYRTSDGGGSWELRNVGLPLTSAIMSLSVNPGNPQVVVAAASDGLFRTTDAGASWTQVGAMARVYAVEFSPAQSQMGYLVGYDTTAHLYVTTDQGATWQVQSSNLILGKATSLIADPLSGDGAWINGGTGVLKTTDRGAHWSPMNAGMRIATISTITACPSNRSRVYLESYQNGVFKSSDCGDNWTRCEDFLSCGNICGIGIVPGVDADILWALEGKG
jgi:photosystem II stability/assembly factor-like uncharacterized protein